MRDGTWNLDEDLGRSRILCGAKGWEPLSNKGSRWQAEVLVAGEGAQSHVA
jgi:hypothetical protein